MRVRSKEEVLKRFLVAVFGVRGPKSVEILDACVEAKLAEQLEHLIDDAFSELSKGEREIIEYRYGFQVGFSYTLAETGDKFKLTAERIRIIEKKALRKIRKSHKNCLRQFYDQLIRAYPA